MTSFVIFHTRLKKRVSRAMIFSLLYLLSFKSEESVSKE